MWWGKKGKVVLLYLWVMCCLTGCGYTLLHQVKSAFQNPHGIYVPVFVNNTDEVGAERVFTNAIIREMQSRGDIIVSSRTPGAYELNGTVTGVSYVPNSLSSTGFRGLQDYRRLPTDLTVSATVSLQLVDPQNQKVLWTGSYGSFRKVAAPTAVSAPTSRTYDYEAPSSLGFYTQSVIESRYIDIARDIARDAYDEMVELF